MGFYEVSNADDFVQLAVLDHIGLLNDRDEILGAPYLPLQTPPYLGKRCDVSVREARSGDMQAYLPFLDRKSVV